MTTATKKRIIIEGTIQEEGNIETKANRLSPQLSCTIDDEDIELKEKATFNLSKSTLLKLEDTWIQLRREFKGEQRITKTSIVEMSLEICIEELTQKEAGSTLYKRLAES